MAYFFFIPYHMISLYLIQASTQVRNRSRSAAPSLGLSRYLPINLSALPCSPHPLCSRNQTGATVIDAAIAFFPASIRWPPPLNRLHYYYVPVLSSLPRASDHPPESADIFPERSHVPEPFPDVYSLLIITPDQAVHNTTTLIGSNSGFQLELNTCVKKN
jgi:hypothetical protein